MKSLLALAPGVQGSVVAVSTDESRGLRLLELGFVPGAKLQVLRRLPLGGALVVELDGGRFALREDEAKLVLVADPSSC